MVLAKPDKTIDPRLLSCAKEVFLEQGFEKASTNVICKKAGVTTGALFKRYATKEDLFHAIVEPVAEDFKHMLFVQKQEFEELPKEKKKEEVFSFDTFNFVDYVYEHFDVFQLLLEGSKGTKYEAYLEELVEIFTVSITDFMKATGSKALILGKDVSPELLHILTRAYLTGLFEPVLHNMEKSAAEKYTEQINYFFSKGWADIFGINM